ncbi:MAG: hypothetical protein Unbinned8622contig1003_1 [Prokaryotic dsDNA virus sp.]|nr:MAG: hypothetical protein Unbinned8622contig1003_1 [Prokaryotic dsDNA virus sp.]|tara:strand:- start:6101 stop:6322 length:222 start_codon:yes stop_codon:yes gene_type:complete
MDFTEEQVNALTLSGSADAISLINRLLAKESLTETEQQRLDRNVAFLNLLVAKDCYTSEELQPLRDAIAATES